MDNGGSKIVLDSSQLEFCRSSAQNIRLLAPAGCGKTESLLHRCRELVQKATRKPRILMVTFTKNAEAELKNRVEHESYFEPIKDKINITTLNAWGWSRIRSRINNPKLLTKPEQKAFAMRHQLRPIWTDSKYIAPVVTKRYNATKLMAVMDNLKSMGFVHTRDVNRSLYRRHIEDLTKQGLKSFVEEQFDDLTTLRVLDSPKRGNTEGPSTSHRDFYDRFFIFWREATERLLEESTFTFDDQKYWNYLDLAGRFGDGERRGRQVGPSGIARYDHVMVDEFQDINPLDLALIKAIVEWHRASLTIVGDDDQAIFEWRGATPEYILHSEQYLGVDFCDYALQVNYRSPRNIVELSQRLINSNKNRMAKQVSAWDGAPTAEIEVKKTDNINKRLELVTDLVRGTDSLGKVAVISRFRRQLIPYQVFFASGGAPFSTAVDLDVFNSMAFDSLIGLLEVWDERLEDRKSIAQIVSDTILVCNNIRRRQLSRKDQKSLTRYLRRSNPYTVVDAMSKLKNYDGAKLSGKSHRKLHEIGSDFLHTERVDSALRSISKGFDGLQWDRELAEADVFYTAPPLEQLADICESKNFDVFDLTKTIEEVKYQAQEYREVDVDDWDTEGLLDRPLHLMTAHRAKGKEFDTVVLLDTVEGIWPPQKTEDQRNLEAERRLFYVAFTRARKKVVVLMSSESGSVSRFVKELELPRGGV